MHVNYAHTPHNLYYSAHALYMHMYMYMYLWIALAHGFDDEQPGEDVRSGVVVERVVFQGRHRRGLRQE